jgi:N-methylhydantoinase B
MNETLREAATDAADINPITLEVVCEGLIAIVKEMRATIIRASYSSVIYEFDDFSCALFGSDGEMVAQSWDHPGHVLPLPWGVRCMMEDFADDLNPGDVILLNDPYRGGTHLNDVTLIYPMFNERGELMIFPAVRAHWVDVGGMVPGSYSGLSTNIYQEGVRIPPIKLYEAGKLNQAAMALLMANMRLPEDRKGDLNASMGACRVAESRIRKLYQKYGDATVLDCVRLNLDRTERRLREQIAKLPDGDYYYEDYLEFFNEGRLDPVRVRFKLTVDGDQIIADFEGTNPQVPGVVNSSLAVAGAGVFVAVKSTLDPGGAMNHGAFRPIELRAPEASVVDVRDDAPAGAHGEVRKRAVSVALGALSQIIPELVSGDLCGSSFPNAIGGQDRQRGRAYVYYEAPAGGNGGFLESDGSSAFVNVDFGNLPSIHNVESIEIGMPILVVSSQLRIDSGGEGMHRGGLGMRREILLLDEEASYSVLSDRAVIPPYGMLGGCSAMPYKVSLIRDGNEIEFDTPGKVTGHPIRRGDMVVMRSSGGGGYDDPLKREPEMVREDVADGHVSLDRAINGYGVVLNSDGSVDAAATKKRREQLQAARFHIRIIADDGLDAYEGVKGIRRVVLLAPDAAAALGVAEDDLLEILGRNPAPLRAWVRIDQCAAADVIRLDDFGRKVLGVADGDQVMLRPLSIPVIPGGLAH